MSVPRLSKNYVAPLCACGAPTTRVHYPCCADCAPKPTRTARKQKRLTGLAASLRKYGLSKEDYQRMQRAQNFKCAICLQQDFDEKRGLRRLCVDHDHKTDKVRGLLCSKCNTMLGMAKDNPEVLERAAAYLAQPQISLDMGG